MKEPINKIDRALDRAVFGTNDPTKIEKKLDKMKQYLELEASSLGQLKPFVFSIETVSDKSSVT